MTTNRVQHTPGPWHANQYNGIEAIVEDGAQIAIAECPSMAGWRPYWEQAANVRLIAAAPELLAALFMALGYVGAAERVAGNWDYAENSDTFKAIDAAIAKARGEGVTA